MIGTIQPYNDKRYTTGDTSSTSLITDKLIRLTAKYTENYAGDICYDISDFLSAVEENRNYDSVLLFGEGGVDTYRVVDDEITMIDGASFIQAWRLTWQSAVESGILQRVFITQIEELS